MGGGGSWEQRDRGVVFQRVAEREKWEVREKLTGLGLLLRF